MKERVLLYSNQSIVLHYKSMVWFLYDKDLRHKKVNENFFIVACLVEDEDSYQ